MDNSKYSLVLGSLDAVAIVGISLYFNNQISVLKTDISENNKKLAALNSYIKSTMDPALFAGLKPKIEQQIDLLDKCVAAINNQHDRLNKLENAINIIANSIVKYGIKLETPEIKKPEEYVIPSSNTDDDVELFLKET